MKFVFNEPKAAQAAAYLLKRHHGSLSLLLMMKLMYLAERRSFASTGRPLTGDLLAALPWGPVLSQVYDLAKGKPMPFESQVWPGSIKREGTGDDSKLVLTGDPGEDLLSRFERTLLDGIDEEFGDRKPFDVSYQTHDGKLTPEWHDPGKSSRPIQHEEILQRVGVPDEEIGEIAAAAEESVFMRQALEFTAKHRRRPCRRG